MNKIYKIGLMALSMCMLFTLAAFAEDETNNTQTKTFVDVDENHRAWADILKMIEAGVLDGYEDGTFKPDAPIKRSQFIKIINKSLGYVEKAESISFTDVKPEDWYYDDLLIAVKAGYISGFNDGTFKPDEYITREQVCKILSMVLELFDLPYDKEPVDTISDWAKPYVYKILASRVMSLDESGRFRALENATRAEVCEAIADHVVLGDIPDLIPEAGGTAGGTGGGGTATMPETPDEIPVKVLTAITAVTGDLDRVIKALSSDAQKEICRDIKSNMLDYKEDPKHDYKKEADKTVKKYNALSEEEKEELKDTIMSKIAAKHLETLKDFFFPDVDFTI